MIDIFLSKPNNYLAKYRTGIIDFENYLRDLKLNPRTIGSSDFPTKGPMDEVIELMTTCRGAIILGIPQIIVGVGMGPEEEQIQMVRLGSEWNHIEAALAYDRGFPLIVIKDQGVSRGVFEKGVINTYIHEMDLSSAGWYMVDSIRGAIAKWNKDVEKFKPNIRPPMAIDPKNLQLSELQKKILLIFHESSLEPLTPTQISSHVDKSITEIRHAIDQLIQIKFVNNYTATSYKVIEAGRAYIVSRLLGDATA